jgi:nucleoid-associated protein YgaU
MKRNFWAILVAVLVLAAAGGALFELRQHRQDGAAPQAVAPPATPPQPQAQTAAEPAPPPSFDAVHVGPDGQAVIAGRAAPGAQVTVLDRGAPVGHAIADANGEWVAMTERPLAPGPQELTLAARSPAGEQRSSSASVAVVVPEHGTALPPVAVLLPPKGAARALGGRDARAQHEVALDIVEYDPAGRTILSGRADPGTQIEVAVNGTRIASVHADGNGEWTVSLSAGVPVGRYTLRLLGQASDGSAAGDLAFEMRRAAPDELGPGGAFSVVPGNNLWHLARRSYGDGLRYVEIYRANREQIDNPDRIYPGQLLELPGKS